ncbi:hypothetical protein H0H81_000181 [Sphagnurus paluster]|uniref:DUF159-domain-containing protein n=1 Tax=Sphagnurus paluster TaxID=117069 RepID=A0A9P7FWJ1_9AGAR|nr:hypothetical protein H0H81_000181 [Sphagnurus paluster]
MCGRFSLRLGRDEIRQVPGHDDVNADDWIDEDEFVPRFNIAPRTYAPVLLRRDPVAGQDVLPDYSQPGPSNTDTTNPKTNRSSSHYVLHSMKWGLVPHWSKYEDKTLSTTNARSESLVEGGGMWGSIKGKKRCAVLCQGYYEWLTKGKEKLPYFTKYRDGKLMLMAGLYDCAILEDQAKPLWTFTIVTTDANKEFSWLHDRQPVILSTREALDTWLDTSEQTWTSKLTELVKPYHDLSNPLECYQVPKEVGKVGTESSTFIEPVASRKDGIRAMFSQQVTKSKDLTEPTSSKLDNGNIKRLRDPSPAGSPSSSKKPRKGLEDGYGSDIVILDRPSTPQKVFSCLHFASTSYETLLLKAESPNLSPQGLSRLPRGNLEKKKTNPK